MSRRQVILDTVQAMNPGDQVTILASEFEVSRAMVRRWLVGTTKPHPRIAERFRIRAAAIGANVGAIPHTPAADNLTPSEVALAKMLSAATDWLRPGHDDDSREANAIRRACAPFVDIGLMYAGTGQSTEAGRALLGRARKAGVL